MKSSNLIVIAFLLIFLSSCSNDREKVLILSLTEGLVKSTETVHQENARLYMIMKEREADPVTQEKYARWAPKIEMLKTESKELGSYIDTIKKGVTENKKFSDGEVLYKKLASFRRDILNIDSPYIEHHFKNILSIVSASYDLSGKNAKDFSNTFFNAASKENTLAILTKLQNNIALLENAALSYLNYTTAIHGCIFRYKPFAAIINQNAKHLKAGDELEINAGVGEFNDSSTPDIIINGHSIPLNTDATATYKLRLSNDLGKHVVPVIINFTSPDGIRTKRIYQIEYFIDK